MARDLFRGIIRTLLVLCLIGGCVEGFYFMGELSKNQTDRYSPYSPYYKNSRSYPYDNIKKEEEIDYEPINTDAISETFKP